MELLIFKLYGDTCLKIEICGRQCVENSLILHAYFRTVENVRLNF